MPTGSRGAPTEGPRFVSGSLLRHVCVMAGTAAIGLIAVFAVDLINLFYISLLGEKATAAAVGFAGVVGFFHTSVCIGLTIGVSALVSRTIGAGRRDAARRIATASLVLMVGIAVVLGSGTAFFLQPALHALGAEGETARLAQRYLAVTVHSLPLLGIGMVASALLRSVGDARRSMTVTLVAAFVTAVLDPILIFGLNLGLDGAAIASVVSRSVMAAIGLHGVWVTHRMLGRFDRAAFAGDVRALGGVAGPAVLTNLATPVGAAFVTHSIAQFGASAVAGAATIDRVSPVAFGLIYSLSGAVGPILAQNLGAGQYRRVREGLRDSLFFMVVAVAVAWLVLALGQGVLIRAFSADGLAAELISLFCTWLAASFFFSGGLFVANASFNNLGHPLLSTGFNWGRATLGTIPFAWWGSHHGAAGVLIGQAVGSSIFGLLAVVVAFRLASKLAQQEIQPAAPGLDAPLAPTSSQTTAAALVRPASD
ncbi:MATE family efflux transporter [Variovorax sp. PAMC 28711]|uniref:MATE family efflux transporter n=1 Tax=Variovorax sp. PAMC 28711 TaxID=1795631 RepID=UPI00078BD1D9|nr:MATE family efflux transporter [Variovorax sp. PAMC 28711]AMM24812.1 multidrug transporter [Variovorax sp. PAMC 28711]